MASADYNLANDKSQSKTFVTAKAGVNEVLLARRERREGAGSKKLREMGTEPKPALSHPAAPAPQQRSKTEVPGLHNKKRQSGSKGAALVQVDSNTVRPSSTPAECAPNGDEWSTNPTFALKSYQNSLRSTSAAGCRTRCDIVPDVAATVRSSDAPTKNKKVLKPSDSAKAAFDKFIHRRDAAKAKHDEKFRQEKDWGGHNKAGPGAGKKPPVAARQLPNIVF